MNEIKLAGILVRKRREKGITQEELANCIGVSKAAVSKWENEQSYPDITLLPQLAAYFNLSIDELLDYSPQLTLKDIRELYHRLADDFAMKPFDEVISECKAITKKYFSCFPLLFQMSTLFVNHCTLAQTPEQKQQTLEDAKSLCERIMLEGKDVLLSKNALYLQCYCSLLLNTPNEIFTALGESLQIWAITEDILIAQAFQMAGNIGKAKEVNQCGMYQHLMSLLESMSNYISLTTDTFDAAKAALSRAIDLIDLYDIEKLNPNLPAQIYLAGANVYCMHGELSKALTFLAKYADLCLTAQGALNRNYEVTVIKDAIITINDSTMKQMLAQYASDGIKVMDLSEFQLIK